MRDEMVINRKGILSDASLLSKKPTSFDQLWELQTAANALRPARRSKPGACC
jgi:hypothetical protein